VHAPDAFSVLDRERRAVPRHAAGRTPVADVLLDVEARGGVLGHGRVVLLDGVFPRADDDRSARAIDATQSFGQPEHLSLNL